MPWLSLKLAATQDEAEDLSDALMAAGALSVSIEDRDEGTAAEVPQFGEPGLSDPKAWQRNWVVALLEAETNVPVLIQQLGLSASHERELEEVAEQDWVRLTQSQFDPIRISQRLWIVPSWHTPPDPDAICIELDPGLAFGTGSHPTTHLCLAWLESHLEAPVEASVPERTVPSLLDYGCGSGILAIAAVRLGAQPVVGVDLDPQAVMASCDNAARNHVQAQFHLPDALPAGQFDVLVANILTNPLKALMPLLAGRVKTGGRIALSGILAEQAEEVMAIYSQAFTMSIWRQQDGWVCLQGVRT